MSKNFSDSNILQDVIDQLEQEQVFYIENAAFTSDYIIIIRNSKVTPEYVENFVRGVEE